MNGMHRRDLRPCLVKTIVRVQSIKKSRCFIIKTALYAGIVFLLMFSIIFIGNAGNVNEDSKIVFEPVSGLLDASGNDYSDSDISSSKLILSQEMPVVYGVDLQQTDTEDNIDEQNEKDIYFDILPENIKMEIMQFSKEPKQFSISSQEPQILIYHTHTEEAYIQITGEEYAESGKWYTKEQNKSVVEVGEALNNALTGYGYSVLHDTTDHQPPSLSTAYSRSLKTMEKYADEYPGLRVYIDLHRDAYNDVEAGRKDYVIVDGEECARVMFVVGTGAGYTGEGFDGKPDYESNYKLAHAITDELENIKKGFTRPIRVKTGRYNQQVSDMCLLIEVGHNANSLQQAINSTKYIALAISRVISMKN
jgi:stage II sporulation protein P